MDKRRAVESEIRRKSLQGMQYGDRYEARSSIFRSNSPPASSPVSSSPSPPASSPTTSLIRPISSAKVAQRLAQFKQIPAQISCSIVRDPYVWLGATWLGLVLIGSIATVVLLRIEPTSPESLTVANPVGEHSVPLVLPDGVQPVPSPDGLSQADLNAPSPSGTVPNPVRQRGASLPLFALGTVAFSCAIGCLLLSYRFGSHAPKVHPRLPTRVQRLPRSAAPSFPKAPAPKVTVPKVTSKSRETTPTELRSSSAKAADGVAVAIVSSNENHPLDWDEPSLADNLDIRQRHPLSHWL